MTPLLVDCAGRGGLTQFANQLVESSGAKDHQGSSDHIAGIAKSVGHFPWNHNHRTLSSAKTRSARLGLSTSMKAMA
jgi:hypothetical protein